MLYIWTKDGRAVELPGNTQMTLAPHSANIQATIPVDDLTEFDDTFVRIGPSAAEAIWATVIALGWSPSVGDTIMIEFGRT